MLHLGCGMRPDMRQDCEVIHLDMKPYPHVEVVFDLDRTKTEPLPFPDEYFDFVLAFDVIEHILYVVPLMQEIHRVLKPNCEVHIHTTHAKHLDAFRDPTHFHFFMPQSFDFFDPNTYWGKEYGFYSQRKFRVLECVEDKLELSFKLRKL
jgi:ubiquinone/menaquinone biosynthesis C-methylase UbiE